MIKGLLIDSRYILDFRWDDRKAGSFDQGKVGKDCRLGGEGQR